MFKPFAISRWPLADSEQIQKQPSFWTSAAQARMVKNLTKEFTFTWGDSSLLPAPACRQTGQSLRMTSGVKTRVGPSERLATNACLPTHGGLKPHRRRKNAWMLEWLDISRNITHETCNPQQIIYQPTVWSFLIKLAKIRIHEIPNDRQPAFYWYAQTIYRQDGAGQYCHFP